MNLNGVRYLRIRERSRADMYVNAAEIRNRLSDVRNVGMHICMYIYTCIEQE